MFRDFRSQYSIPTLQTNPSPKHAQYAQSPKVGQANISPKSQAISPKAQNNPKISDPNLHKERGIIKSIEAVRFIIATWIVFCHYFDYNAMNFEYLKNLVYNNQGSVYGFIVISGFMTHWTSRNIEFNGPKSISDFYSKRFLRIYVTYFIAVMMAFIVRYPGLTTKFDQTTEYTVSSHLGFTGINLLMLQSWFVGTPDEVYDGPAFALGAPFWTISSLAFCWLVYPLVSHYCITRGKARTTIRDIVIIFGLGILHRTLNPGDENNYCAGWGPYQGFFWFPPANLPLFYVGAFGAELAATFYEQGRRSIFRNHRHSWFTMGLLVDLLFILFFYFNVSNMDVKLGLHYSLGCYTRTIPILLGCIISTQHESLIFGSRLFSPAHWAAQFALAMYVFQSPLVQIFEAVAFSGFPVIEWPKYQDPVIFGLFYGTLIVFSAIYTLVIEKKIVKRFKSSMSRQQKSRSSKPKLQVKESFGMNNSPSHQYPPSRGVNNSPSHQYPPTRFASTAYSNFNHELFDQTGHQALIRHDKMGRMSHSPYPNGLYEQHFIAPGHGARISADEGINGI